MSWAGEEFKGIDLGDKRLGKRAVLLAERLAERPTASIAGACGGWAETQGAYRFFAHDEMDWRDILEPHWRCSAARMRGHEIVLCIQDTTEVDFNGQDIAGLGPLSYEAQRGMYLHPTYAVTLGREPLGVLDAWMWARQPKDAEGHRGGVLESTRWVEGYERVAELAGELPQTRRVYVADREADIAALMAKARDLGMPAEGLIRSRHNRKLPTGGKLWNRVSEGEALGEIQFTLPSRHGQKARPVRQQVWARRVELSEGKGGRLEATCIVAREVGAPQGVKPIEWRLLTNREAARFEAAAELIDWYRALGDRSLLPCAEKRLPRGGVAAQHDGTPGTGAGAVYGDRLAHRPADASGAHLSGLGGGVVVRARGMGGSLHPEQETPTEEAAPPQ
jgi:hypothetical protein